MSEHGDLVADVRAAGIACPSCGVNMADVPDGHALAIYDASDETAVMAECALGSPALLVGSFELLKAAANIALYDEVRRHEAEAFKLIAGTGPANFTGLLGALNGGGG